MKDEVTFTPAARADLLSLYAALLDRAKTQDDLAFAERALNAVDMAVKVQLSQALPMNQPLIGRQELRRELMILFGAAGYVALCEVVDPGKILVLAVRHQRDDDHHGE